jgi:hypothetical protein
LDKIISGVGNHGNEDGKIIGSSGNGIGASNNRINLFRMEAAALPCICWKMIDVTNALLYNHQSKKKNKKKS